MMLIGMNALVITLLAYAAWRDLLTRTIPDALSIGLVVLGLAARATQGWEAVASSLGVALGLFVCLVPMIRLGIMGGADVKLLSALAVGLPPLACMDLLVLVSVSGALLALVYMAMRTIAPVATASRSGSWVARAAAVELWRIRRRAALPYGIAIALGTAFLFVITPGA